MRRIAVLSMIVLLASLACAQDASACARCARTPESTPWSPIYDCFAVPTGITGTIQCFRNSYGGCTGYGSFCHNGQHGPPSPWDTCFFWGEGCPPDEQWACVPESRPLLTPSRSTPLTGRTTIRIAGLAVSLSRYSL